MKLKLPKVTGVNQSSVINNNFDLITKELQTKVLYRNNPNGEPNALEKDLDANGNDINNVSTIRADQIFVDGVALLNGGLVGPVGPKGSTGATGAQGPQGASGPASTVGPQGIQGIQGVQGPIGSTGAAGISGTVGPQGPSGSNGANGATGASGPVGATGPAGAASTVPGPTGTQGSTGAVGATGAQGPRGDVGPAGGESKFQALAYATSLVWNDLNGTTARVTLTGPSTLQAITNLKVGLHILVVDQDATGGRVLGFDASYKTIDAAASTTANTRAIYWLISDGSSVTVSVYRAAIALSTPAPVNGFPTDVVATYYEIYNGGTGNDILDVPAVFNVVYLFTAAPVPGAGNEGKYTNANIGEPHATAAKIQTVRARGQKVLITVGGSGLAYQYTNRTESQNFIDSFALMYTAAGGVDGCDFNNFEVVASNETEMAWIATRLKQIYGSSFAVTCPPQPDANFRPGDRLITKAMDNAGSLTYAAPQFYDYSGFKAPGNVKGYVDQWVTHLGNQDQVVVGFSANFNLANSLTKAEAEREWASILAAYPNIRGFYIWNTGTSRSESNITASSLKSMLLAARGGTAPAPSDQALTTAMSGQVGAWLDGAATYLRSPTNTAITAVAQAVGKFVDRSGGAKDAIMTAPDESYYRESGAFKYVQAFGAFKSSTGGGSGVNGATGFFSCTAVKVTSDYPYIYSDGTTLNNGRHISYDAGIGKVVFRVGTGTVSVAVTSQALVTTLPSYPTTALVIKTWQDGTNIYLQVNGGTVVTATSAACATPPALTNYAISGSFVASPGYSGADIYYHFHTLNPLDVTKRDSVTAYITGKIG
jgi:hypothetical protein